MATRSEDYKLRLKVAQGPQGTKSQANAFATLIPSTPADKMPPAGAFACRVQTFADLLQQQPGVDLSFWKVWYFGNIPWERATVTPASVLQSPQLQILFDSATTAAIAPTAPHI